MYIIDLDEIIKSHNEKNEKQVTSHDEAARILGTSKKTLSFWRKKAPKSVELLVKLSEFSGKPIDEVLIKVEDE